MTILLVGINAKFIQSNLAIRLLQAYARRHAPVVTEGRVRVEIAEWNVNQQVQSIVRGIYSVKPDAVLFSTYIWNRDVTFEAAETLRSIMPDLCIGAGGPEVSHDPARSFSDCPALDCVILGEGERTLAELAGRFAKGPFDSAIDPREEHTRAALLQRALADVSGLAFPGETAVSFTAERAPIEDLSEIPFPYGNPDDDIDPVHRIVYYESSRGCPYGCAYCLSSIGRAVRFYPLERTFEDLDFFLDNRWPLVKFVDRTFNIAPERYRAIWQRIADRHNGVTRFHFEIAADLLTGKDFEILDRMPEGAVQFEIGVQSANPETLAAVSRKTDLALLARAVRRIPKAIHTHVDLIAGLPHEGPESFARSFDFAFSLGADVVQLGFLKILSGTAMERMARGDSAYRWSKKPPYEVLSSPNMGYADLLSLKDVEHVVDNLWNTGVFRGTIGFFVAENPSPFAFFRNLASFIASWFPDGDLFLPRRIPDLFACMAAFAEANGGLGAREWLKFDFFMQAKPGKVPVWLNRRYSKEAHDGALERSGFLEACGGVRRTAYARSEFEVFTFPGKKAPESILFTYPAPGEKSSGTRFEIMPYNDA